MRILRVECRLEIDYHNTYVVQTKCKSSKTTGRGIIG